ncbi:MAG: hypothetical protein IT210_03620 [Armatimonadetes bacterium]|nr:hypothetical protein [Armatimonadota bacterium]
MKPARTSSPSLRAGSDRPAGSALLPRSAAIAILIGVLCILSIAAAIRYVELVTGQYISTGVPPLPALAVLMALSLLRPLLGRRYPRLTPSRAQILLIYAMLTLSVILSGLYHVRAFLPHLIALQYWGRPDSRLASMGLGEYARHLPAWYAPRDPKAILDYYEGTTSGIPWHAWTVPLFWWSLFFIIAFIGVFCAVTLVQKQWIRHEKLSFPLLTIPLTLTSGDWSSFGPRRSRRALFLIGFGLAAAYNIINILHILYPSMPNIAFSYSLNTYFPNRPWSPFGAVSIFFFLEAIGIGYFMPLEISFSVWFFYLLNRLIAVGGTAAGYDAPGFPFSQEQSAGGYIAVGLFLLWGLRRTLRESLRQSFAKGKGNPTERWAWAGLAGSVVFVLGFCYAAGFSLRLAVPFFALIGLITLVYARIRAESGIPFQFIHPYGLPKDLILNAISFPTALQWGGVGSLVLFSSFNWVSQNDDPMEQAAYSLDSVKLGQESRIPFRTLFIALLIAFVVGLGAAYWVHLSAYYAQGSNLTPSAGGIGEAREEWARQDYTKMHSRLQMPPARETPPLVASLGGFLFASGLAWLRGRWFASPFHPLGFLIANSAGDSPTCWFAIFVAWLCKAIAIRFGGLRLYRQGIPLFLGIAVGHFLIGGIFWPVFALSLTKEAANAYHIIFGD